MASEDSPPLHPKRRGSPPNRTGSEEDNSSPSPDLDTQFLIRKAESGDEKAVDQLYRRYLTRVEAWSRGKVPSKARGLYDTASFAQEVLVKTLLHAVESRGAIRESFRAYLRRAIENRLADLGREADHGRQEVDDQLASPEPGPLELLIEREFELRAAEAIASLPSDQRQLLRLRFDQGWSYGTIASVLGLDSEDAARMRVTRTLGSLRERLTEAAQS